MSTTSLFLAFEVVDEIDDDFDTAANDDNFGSWYLIFVFARWSSMSNTSLFLTFEVVDETDGDFDTADNDDGDDAEEKSVDDRDDTVEGVETNGLSVHKIVLRHKYPLIPKCGVCHLHPRTSRIKNIHSQLEIFTDIINQ